jgi:putative N-acetyltransferase (TIGR04045 family)
MSPPHPAVSPVSVHGLDDRAALGPTDAPGPTVAPGPTTALADLGWALTGAPPAAATSGGVLVREAASRADHDAYRRLRRQAFVDEQALFPGSDRDDWDDHPAAVVLVAATPDGAIVGGVRLTPGDPGRDLAWWLGSRLVVERSRRGQAALGAALVRAACATAEGRGALRFEATVQRERSAFFRRLGWSHLGMTTVAGRPHDRVRWPIDRISAQVAATKAPLAGLLDGLRPGGDGWVGDDAAPVPGSDLLAACDAIVPTMVDRDPWWAGWCGVLVNINDITVKGATPVGLLDAVGARTASQARRVLAGVRAASQAWGVPILGGHTTLGVHGSLSVTALGRAERAVPAGGGAVGDDVVVAADLGGSWRPGYAGRQWDSTTSRTPAELRAQAGLVARWRPAAAKDVSMAGLVGTLGMLAEASGAGADLEIAAVPAPGGVSLADWLACFPGFAVVAADRPAPPDRRSAGAPPPGPGTAAGTVASARCGRLRDGAGVDVVWPDGERIRVVGGPVTGLGQA